MLAAGKKINMPANRGFFLDVTVPYKIHSE